MSRRSLLAVLALLVALCVVAVPACKKDEAETDTVSVGAKTPAANAPETKVAADEGAGTEAEPAGAPIDAGDVTVVYPFVFFSAGA